MDISAVVKSIMFECKNLTTTDLSKFTRFKNLDKEEAYNHLSENELFSQI